MPRQFDEQFRHVLGQVSSVTFRNVFNATTTHFSPLTPSSFGCIDCFVIIIFVALLDCCNGFISGGTERGHNLKQPTILCCFAVIMSWPKMYLKQSLLCCNVTSDNTETCEKPRRIQSNCHWKRPCSLCPIPTLSTSYTSGCLSNTKTSCDIGC